MHCGPRPTAESDDYLVPALRAARPADGILSEESADDRSRLTNRRVWIIDPLDGTREYGEPGRSDWAVHVALAIDGVAEIGAVALPARDLVLRSDEAPPLAPASGGRPRLVVSRTRPPACLRPSPTTSTASSCRSDPPVPRRWRSC